MNRTATVIGIRKVLDATFETEVLASPEPIVVDFYADWCGPCQAMTPILEELAEEFSGRVAVAKMDTDVNPLTPRKYGIRGIPTLLFFKKGELVGKSVGLASKKELRQVFEDLAK